MEVEELLEEPMDNSNIHALVDIKILIGMKQRFTSQELTRIYEVYNRVTGQNKKPNGCSSCLNNTLTRLKKEFRKYGI